MSEVVIPKSEVNVQSAAFEVIPADVCMEWLAEKIEGAEHRVAIQAMAMQLGAQTGLVFDAMKRKAQEGVEVRCIVDGYSMMFDDDRLVLFPTTQGRLARAAVDAFKNHLDDLASAGVDVAVTQRYSHVGIGINRYNPYANRNHIKGYAADDMVALAGPNLQDNATDKYDFMLATNNMVVADWWYEFTAYEAVHGVPPADKDYKVSIDDGTEIIVDVGSQGESLIYDTVCSMLSEHDVAQVTYINQMFPVGRIAEALELLQARVGADNVEVITCHYDQFSQPAKALTWLRQKNAKLAFNTSTDKPIHTKTVIITRDNGEKIAIVTSNNLDERGIAYGTAEVAVMTKNAKSIQNIENYCGNISHEKFR